MTDRDLFIALGTQNRRPADLPVGEIMNQDVSICGPGDDVGQALKTMAKKKSHRLPVVDENGALKGILSIDDMRAETDGLSKDVLKTMRAICDRANQRVAEV